MFLSLKGTFLPDHGYVMISDIGSTAETALLCNTNHYSDDLPSGGNWYTPDGTRVGYNYSADVPGFTGDRGSQVVRLKRSTHTDRPAEGMYHCTVMNATSATQTLYIGLYSQGGWSAQRALSYHCLLLCLF